MDDLAVGGGIVYMILVIFLFVLGILWFLLPFAVFGIKNRLDLMVTEIKQVNVELRRSNAELWDLRKQVGSQVTPPTAPALPDQ